MPLYISDVTWQESTAAVVSMVIFKTHMASVWAQRTWCIPWGHIHIGTLSRSVNALIDPCQATFSSSSRYVSTVTPGEMSSLVFSLDLASIYKPIQGSHPTWKIWNFVIYISRPGKCLEFAQKLWKTWNFVIYFSRPGKCLEFAQKLWKTWNFNSNPGKSCTVKLLYNGHPFCRGLVAVVDECPLVSGCGKMSTNPSVWRGQGRLINTKLVPRSFRPTKKWTDLEDGTYEWYISSCISSRLPWSFIS